jgi:NHL repeat
VSEATAGGWQPLRVLGAPGGALGALGPARVGVGAAGGVGTGAVGAAGAALGWQPAGPGLDLALPCADASAGTLYAPRGVLLDPERGRTRVIAADTGNHRLLVWPDLPDVDGADSAVVIGQPDARSEGPQAGGRGPQRGLHLPTGLARTPELLLVADAWNHRVLGFDAALDADDPAPVLVLGQDDLTGVGANRDGEPDGSTLYWPFGVLWHDGWLWVADTGNRRVLGWHGLPEGRRPADVVLGQPKPDERAENRGGEVAGDSFRWPHQLAVLDGVLWVADAGNHRLLGWRLPLIEDRPAELLLGQRSITAAFELPHVPQGPSRMRFPYAVVAARGGLLVGDTANNRVLGWSAPPSSGAEPVAGQDIAIGPGADVVLGQVNFDRAGENRWTAVAPDTLCWPYGMSAAADPRHGDVLAIADSGNNRVVLWHHPPDPAPTPPPPHLLP